MPDDKMIWVEFDGPHFPVWVAVNLEAEPIMGESRATHYTAGDAGENVLPLFTTEAAAAAYIRNQGLDGHTPAKIASPIDLLIRLEQFRTRGGTHVAIDLAAAPPPGTPIIDLAPFIEHVRGI